LDLRALGLCADPLPVEWTHLIGMASLNTEKLEQVLFEKGRSCGSPSKGKLIQKVNSQKPAYTFFTDTLEPGPYN
jgi:hypothetical protein